MGRNLKLKFAAAAVFAASNKKTLRRMLLSLISLTLAVVAFTTTTFSWFTASKSDVNATNFKLDCGKGLRVNDTGTSELEFSQVEKYLIPASSVDGRNLYFPTDGSDFSNITNQMTFRSANVGDKNVNYIQIDFTLTAQQNHTALYINDEKTSIKVAPKLGENETRQASDYTTQLAAPLRAALWSSTAESGVPNTPIVFNSTNSTVYTAAVADIDHATGTFVGDGRQVAHTFSDYSSSGLPVATLEKNVETKFSFIVWLEGTDTKCTDKVLGRDIQINLAFSTSWDKTQTIRFKDETSNGWVKNLWNDHYTFTLHYKDPVSNEPTDFTMYNYLDTAEDEWTCNIPGDMKSEITFILRPSARSIGTDVYKFTKSFADNGGTFTTDRGTSRQYVAKSYPINYPDGNYNLDECLGDWVAIGDSDGSGHDNGGSGGFDGDDF